MEAMPDDVEWRVQYLLGEPISGNGLLKERAAKHFIQWEDAGSKRHTFTNIVSPIGTMSNIAYMSATRTGP